MVRGVVLAYPGFENLSLSHLVGPSHEPENFHSVPVPVSLAWSAFLLGVLGFFLTFGEVFEVFTWFLGIGRLGFCVQLDVVLSFALASTSVVSQHVMCTLRLYT